MGLQYKQLHHYFFKEFIIMGKENPKIVNGVDAALKLYGYLVGNGADVPPPTLQQRLARLYETNGGPVIQDGTLQYIVKQAVTEAYKPRKKNGKQCG